MPAQLGDHKGAPLPFEMILFYLYYMEIEKQKGNL